MKSNFKNHIIKIMTDWLIALCGVLLTLWWVLTLPVFNTTKAPIKLSHVSTLNLKKHVEVLVHKLSPRTIQHGNLNNTAQYIYQELSKYGSVKYQTFSTIAGQYSNVLLELGPDTDEIFIIGAHYDAQSSSLDIDGNASGVSSLIELARNLAENSSQLSQKVHLVSYPLSQIKLTRPENMGSYYHAQNIKLLEKKVILMISLDGVGNFSNQEKSQNYPYKFMRFFYPDKGNYISLIGQIEDYSEVRRMKKSFKSASTLPLYSFNVPTNYSPTNSYDHLNYQAHGFPAVLLTDTAKYRKISKRDDAVEQFNYTKMAELVASIYQVVMDRKASKEPDFKVVRQQKIKPMQIH